MKIILYKILGQLDTCLAGVCCRFEFYNDDSNSCETVAQNLMANISLFLSVVLLATISKTAVADLLKDQVIDINGSPRTYDLYLPDNNSIDLNPLVLLLHGNRGDADVMTGENNKIAPYKSWRTIAEREGWVLLIPDGEFGSNGHRGWNDCRENAKTNPTTDDVNFLGTLIDKVSSQYPIDKNRVYVHGTSNGGNMAYRLAIEGGEKYRAIAAVAASMPKINKCKQTNRPISVLVMNGTKDPILPFQGGNVGRKFAKKNDRGSVLSASDTIEYWLDNNDINSRHTKKLLADVNKDDKSRVYVSRYIGGVNNTEVILYEIRGGGHTEPSLKHHYRPLYKLIVGNQNKDIEMTEEVWEFFNRNQ